MDYFNMDWAPQSLDEATFLLRHRTLPLLVPYLSDDLPVPTVVNAMFYLAVAFKIRQETYHTDGIKGIQTPEAHRAPLASWMRLFFATSFGMMAINALLGLPIGNAFASPEHWILATCMWYAVSFSPFDSVYLLCNTWLGKFILNTALAYRNARNIPSAVQKAASIFPNTIFVPFLCGVLSGWASSGALILDATLRQAKPVVNELFRPTFTFKFIIASAFGCSMMMTKAGPLLWQSFLEFLVERFPWITDVLLHPVWDSILWTIQDSRQFQITLCWLFIVQRVFNLLLPQWDLFAPFQSVLQFVVLTLPTATHPEKHIHPSKKAKSMNALNTTKSSLDKRQQNSTEATLTTNKSNGAINGMKDRATGELTKRRNNKK